MDNASKALMMAATILLAVLLIGIFINVFRAGSSVSESYDKKQQVEQLELYNSKFELYSGQTNTIMDLITVANLAYSVNKECEYDAGNSVLIEIEADGQSFSIPNTDDGLIRNEIRIGHTTSSLSERNISIYKLATLTLEQLGTNPDEDNKEDKLSLTKYAIIDNKEHTIYKYLFDCKEIKYDHTNGKVSKMVFDMYINPEW